MSTTMTATMYNKAKDAFIAAFELMHRGYVVKLYKEFGVWCVTSY